MTGVVDDSGAAMLLGRIKPEDSQPITDLDAWVDTGFTGDLVMSSSNIAALKLLIGAGIDAILADGSLVQLDTYTCLNEWFGEWKQVEVIANQGQVPLLGVGLLLDHDLHIDYRAKKIVAG